LRSDQPVLKPGQGSFISHKKGRKVTEPIKFLFDEKKATAAAALLLSKAPEKRMNRGKLLTLLFLAELESLKRRGCPIIGGEYVNVPDKELFGEDQKQ
jgi:hypothetical protein